MTQVFQKLSQRYANVSGVLIGLAVVSSILLYSGCSMSSSSPKIPSNPFADTRPPTVASFSPAAGATATVDTNVVVNFSESIDPSTVNTSTIELRDPSNALVPATVFFGGSFSAALNPNVDLAPRVTYTVRVRGGSTDPRVKDLAGNALAADVTWSFTTTPVPLLVPFPAPRDGLTDVPTTVAPIFPFTKQLNPSSVNATAVLFTDAAGAPVPFNVFLDQQQFTVRLVPAAPLQPEQTYKITLKGGPAATGITDIEGVTLAQDFVISFTTATAPPPIATLSIFTPPNDMPADPISDDDGAVEVGLKFSSDVDGLINGVRFYKGGAANGGPHVGHLWTSAGTLLGSVVFTDETESGWQQASFLAPVPITAGTLYIVSYFAPHGHYALNTGQLASSRVVNGVLHAFSAQESGGNGVLFYDPLGGFPNNTSNGNNYWVDVIFANGQAPPQVLSVNPAPGAAGVSTVSSPTASFSKPLNSTTVTAVNNVELFDTGYSPVPADVSYNEDYSMITVTPRTPLLPSQAYTVSLHGGPGGITDLTGAPLDTDYTWTFSTAPAGPPATTFSIFAPTSTPANPTDFDPQPKEVGLKFRSNTDGFITGVRFYKASSVFITPHVGHLWTSDGKLLGSAAFVNETNGAWQEAAFPTPIPVTAGTVYVVSYFSPFGYEARDIGAFNNGVNSDPLFALSNSEAGGGPIGSGSFGNGVYLLSPQGGFPVFSNLASNYWVDVIFVARQP
ncbi:MAG TPA: DUF4082 domain-containing protein [Blastocatellia bacterium]